MKKRTIIFIATCAYAGYIPILAGTIGSVEGILLSLILNFNLGVKAIGLIFFLLVGLYVTDEGEKILRQKDDHSMVIDELAGAIVSTFFLPHGIWPWIVALIAFRLFDWLKPFPLRQIEKWRGGEGVMFDDCLAGLYSLGFTWMVHLIKVNLWR